MNLPWRMVRGRSRTFLQEPHPRDVVVHDFFALVTFVVVVQGQNRGTVVFAVAARPGFMGFGKERLSLELLMST
jgi:hypothetical protein